MIIDMPKLFFCIVLVVIYGRIYSNV